MDTISLNGHEYVLKSAANSNIKIVVLQRGWVMVGYFSQDGQNCRLERASVIRIWGTTKGLGEISKNGPTKDTKLDPTNGLVEFHELTVVCMINCEELAWAQKLM
jgi:uncharacterized protein YunC (DUF1805 family)